MICGDAWVLLFYICLFTGARNKYLWRDSSRSFSGRRYGRHTGDTSPPGISQSALLRLLSSWRTAQV